MTNGFVVPLPVDIFEYLKEEEKTYPVEDRLRLYLMRKARGEKIQQKQNFKYNSIFIKDLLGVREEKDNPIIKNFLPEKSMVIIFGEPASCKSLLQNYMVCCVSVGKKFLGQYKTRKLPVLLISSENPQKTDTRRLKAIFKGMRVIPKRRKEENILLHYCGRNSISYISDDEYYEDLKKLIEIKKIKLLAIDTISPLISDSNDNLSADIVNVFNNRLFPLIDKYGLTILIVIHSQKTGKDFLGSVKLKASADAFYELKRNNDVLNLLCHKDREGEHNLELRIGFENNKGVLHTIDFNFINEFGGKKDVNKTDASKLKEAKLSILEILEGKELRYTELLNECINRGNTKRTSVSAISSLYKSKEIAKHSGREGGYYIT